MHRNGGPCCISDLVDHRALNVRVTDELPRFSLSREGQLIVPMPPSAGKHPGAKVGLQRKPMSALLRSRGQLLENLQGDRDPCLLGLSNGWAARQLCTWCIRALLIRILAQFRTGSHWLSIETGRHKDISALDRSCPACSYKCVNPGLPADQFDSFDSDEESTDPVEDEHHVIFDCPSYTYARQLFPDIFGSNIVTVSQFLNQPDCNRVARFLTWVRHMRMNMA